MATGAWVAVGVGEASGAAGVGVGAGEAGETLEAAVEVPATSPAPESAGVGAGEEGGVCVWEEELPLVPEGVICPWPEGWLATVRFRLDCEGVPVEGWAKAIQSKLVSAVTGWLVWMVKPAGVLVATP